jgi:hypothetical protein
MTIARRYPVARERAFKADIERTARRIGVIGGCYYRVIRKISPTTYGRSA